MMERRPWIQAAIDVEDIELAKKIAFMALDNGAEWLEVGTPLLYRYGHHAIGLIREAVGKGVTLVADYKAPFAMLVAEQAAREGADYVMLFTSYYDFLIDWSISSCAKAGVKPIFDLEVRQEDMVPLAKKLVSKGAEYIFTRHYGLYGDDIRNLEKKDIISMFPSERNFKLGITSDNLDEAVDAARMGADWITFGVALKSADSNVFKRWMDSIHDAGRILNGGMD